MHVINFKFYLCNSHKRAIFGHVKSIKRLPEKKKDVTNKRRHRRDEEALPPIVVVLIGGNPNNDGGTDGATGDGAEQEPVEVAAKCLGLFGVLSVELVGAERRQRSLNAADAEGQQTQRGVEIDGGATFETTGLATRRW